MEPVFSIDRVEHAFASVDASGVTVDEDDTVPTVDFSWSEIPVVEVDAPPYEEAFETDRFYKIPNVTTARPIIQLYRSVDGELIKRQKPAEELRKAAWSFNNAPHTITHPDTGVVKDVSDVTGFWRDGQYDAETESMQHTLYVPVNNDEATEYIAENPDVSVGFYNHRTTSYDGDTGSLVDEQPTEYQVNILGNHIASVEHGRCSGEQGCGIAADGTDVYNKDIQIDETTTYETQKDQTMNSGSWVQWDASGGTAYGKVDEVIQNGCTTRGKGDMEVCAKEDDPVAVVEVYDDESGESQSEYVRHLMSELRSWGGPTNDAVDEEMDMRPPQAAQDAASKVLGWRDEGKVPDRCGTDVGWSRANQLANGEQLSWDTISRMSQFARHEDNSSVEDGKEPFEDCGYVMWEAWGGDEGVSWAQTMMDKKDDMDTDAMAPDFMEGEIVQWQANPEMVGKVVHNPDERDIIMVELMEKADGMWQSTGFTVTAGYSDVQKMDMMGEQMDSSLVHDYREDDEYYAIGPDENADDEPKYPINNCNDATDAWNLRGRGEYDISQEQLEMRIKRRANELDCDLPDTAMQEDAANACGCASNDGYEPLTETYQSDYYDITENEDMSDTDTDNFDISVTVDRDSVTVDSLAEQFDAVKQLRDEYRAVTDSMDEIRASMDLDDDVCPCDHIDEVVEQAADAEQLRDELAAYRADEKAAALDTLVDEYNAEPDEWEDASLDAIEAEIERREEILSDFDMSVKAADVDTDEGADVDTDDDEMVDSYNGKRTFKRGYRA
jgi:hypothetical protein